MEFFPISCWGNTGAVASPSAVGYLGEFGPMQQLDQADLLSSKRKMSSPAYQCGASPSRSVRRKDLKKVTGRYFAVLSGNL